MPQTIHPKKATRRPKIIQIQAVEWEGSPTIVALFDDGQLMHGYFTGDSRVIQWTNIQIPEPQALA